MPVTSRDTLERPSRDYSLMLGRACVIVIALAFGGIVFAINGGFSIEGLKKAAELFNDHGKIAWAIITRWQFDTPQIPYVPARQPTLPWAGIIATSVLQIIVIYRKLTKQKIPVYMLLGALLVSLYDIVTTFYGLTTVAWIARAGGIVQIILALFITFLFELSVSLIIKEVRK